MDKFYLLFHKVEKAVVITALLFLALIPFTEVLIRKFFDTGFPASGSYIPHLVLITAYMGGTITSRKGEHLAINLDFLKHLIPSDITRYIKSFAGSLVSTVLFWSSLGFVFTGFDLSQKVGLFPLLVFSIFIPLGYFVMMLRSSATEELTNKQKIVTTLTGNFTGTLIAMSSINNFLYIFTDSPPQLMETLVNFSEQLNGLISLPLIIFLIIAALLGTPIFVVIGGIGLALFAGNASPLEIIPNEAYAMLTSHSVPAIPLFTLAGFILSESKAGERLVKFFTAFFGWIPNGLAIMTITVCAFFTTFTGASGVTILALGALLSYILKERGYSEKFSTGLITSSGSIGLLFPPSLPIIIYGVTAGISIKKMFLGGIIPGLVMIAAIAVGGLFLLKRRERRSSFSISDAAVSLKESIWEVLLPVIILVCFFGGLTTLVESSALAVVYIFIVEVFINRDIKIRQLPSIVMKCVPVIGGVLTILALAKGLSYFIVDTNVPEILTEWAKTNIGSKYVFLFILNIVLLIAGCLMDIFSAILVIVPLIIPLGNLFGIDPVHLGIIFLANMEIGYLTPPVGLNLFLASYRFKKPINTIYRYVLPFFIIQLITLLLITYVPSLTTALL